MNRLALPVLALLAALSACSKPAAAPDAASSAAPAPAKLTPWPKDWLIQPAAMPQRMARMASALCSKAKSVAAWPGSHHDIMVV